MALEGLETVWTAIGKHRAALEAAGERARRRAAQALTALWSDLGGGLISALKHRPDIAARIPEIEARVREGALTPTTGARHLLELFLGKSGEGLL